MATLGTLTQFSFADTSRFAMSAEDIRCVADVIRFHARQRGAHHASRFEGRTTTYGELDQRSSQIARALSSEGLKKGDRVAYLGKNSDEYFELLFGCAKAGVVLVPVNWRLPSTEIAYIMQDAEAQLLFVGPELADFVNPAALIRRIVSMGNEATDWLNFSEWYARQPPDDPMTAIEHGDVALQLYTSGTTDRPKGAQLTHGNLMADGLRGPIESQAHWQPEDVSLIAMPVAHIGGTGWGFLGYCIGAVNVIMREFEAHQAVEHIENEHITRLFASPAALQMMLRVPRVRERDFFLLHCIVYGGAPISVAVLREAIDVFQCDFCQWYCMTETSGPITCLSPADHDVGGNPRMRSAGKPLEHVELRVRRPDGAIAGPNERGEIEFRSGQNMLGYWRPSRMSPPTFTEDGWLKSGDAGYLDQDGYLYLQDRVQDTIVTGGQNVYPAEVEAVISGCPGVAEVAIIGSLSKRWGEVVKAIVVPARGARIMADDIIDYTMTRIDRFKAPKSVDFVDRLPRDANGKLMRHKLRKRYWHGRERDMK